MRGDIVMGSKDIHSASNYANLHLTPVRKIHLTVEVIDKNNRTIETVEGLSTGGSVSVSNSSLIRRTGGLSFVLFEELLPKKESILWMTNKIRVYAGIENMSSNSGITHFCLGTFYITEPQIEITSESRSISISLQDNMMRWEQEQIENKIEIEAGTPLHTAITQVMNLHGEFNTIVDFTDLTVPYTLEYSEGTTVLEIITQLRDLYMDWECYYDIDGSFVFKKINIQREDGEPTSWRFDNEGDLITTFNQSFTYKNVKNRVVVIGQMDEGTGLTPRSEATILNEDSPFHKDSIGVRSKVITEGNYGTVEQCNSKARYELFKSSTFQEQIEINTLPIYYLDANDIIEVRNHATKELEKYVVNSVGMGLSIDSLMTLNCHKLYYNHFDTGGSIEEYRESADIIINGIQNKGWLSLSEQKVKDYFGLEGDGSDLIVRFEHQTKYGVTAYVTGYVGNDTQTLTIDLADFENSLGDSGDNGTGKAEYSDRVLGHEMVHAIMNNSLGINMTMNLPEWFKEGVSEYIHGADERLKNSIVLDGMVNSNLVDELVSTATSLLNGDVWKAESDYYSAGYVIVKYLDSRLEMSGRTMRDLMHSIKESPEIGEFALKEAITDNTSFESYQEFVTNFSDNASNHIKYNMEINIGTDEIDTGSIDGSDGRGDTDLNAEDTFDNSLATEGVSATGFNVIFDRP